jgi:hypothetical protein
MGQARTRPYVIAATDYEVIDDPGGQVLAPGEYEEVLEDAPAKEPTWAESLGLHGTTDSPILDLLRGAATGAVDLAQGATASVRNQVNKGGDPKLRQMLGAPPVEETADVMQAPESFSAKVGEVLPDVALMAAPVGGAAKAAANAVPRAARAGQKFQEVMGAAKHIPIETKEVGDAALRINQLAERGGSMPMSVRKLLNRLTDPNKAAMTYEESRDFASNISRLSADEMKRLQPVVRREVAHLSAAINKANAEAAKKAGKAAEYKSAMREYRQAMQLRDALDTVIRKAKQAALPAAGLGGAAYWFGKD